MAYQAQINIKTTGLAGLNKINASVDRINKSIIAINKGGSKIKAGKDLVKTSQQDLKIKKDILKVETDIANQLQRQKNLQGKRVTGARPTGGGGTKSTGKSGGGNVISSALISGSFPLLFGQGIPGAVAGGLGGGIGAAVGGQMGGFAGGLVATSLLQIFQSTADKLNTLGQALNDPSRNIQVLIDRIKFFDKSVGDSISTLQSAGLDRVAGDLARITLENRVGSDQLKPIKILNKEMEKFAMLSRDLGSKINSLVAGPLTLFFKTLNIAMGGKNKTPLEDLTVEESIAKATAKAEGDIKIRDAAKAEVTSIKERLQKSKQIVEITRQRIKDGEKLSLQEKRDAQRAQNVIVLLNGKKRRAIENLKIAEEELGNGEKLIKIFEIEKQILASQTKELKNQLQIQSVKTNITRGATNEKALAVAQKTVEISRIDQKISKEKAQLDVIERDGTKRQIAAQETKLANLKLEKQLITDIANERIRAADPTLSRIDELNRELLKLNDTQLQTVELSKAIGSSFEESFKGVVKGTLTVQQAFARMLNRIADHFLDLATKLMSNKLQSGILGLISRSVGGGSVNFGKFDLGISSGSNFMDTPQFLKFADGGRPPVGRPSIVGEKGPELFVPRSSGNIIPNNKLGGGSTNNVVVNVDASGSDVQGDDAAAKELGSLISVAVQGELLRQQRPGGLLSR